MSYEALHRFHKRALPEEMMKFKHAIQLYKNFNDDKQNETWLNLNFQQNFGQRQDSVRIFGTSITRVGKNNMINRLNVINGKIPYDWLNLSLNTYKVRCKTLFLTN